MPREIILGVAVLQRGPSLSPAATPPLPKTHPQGTEPEPQRCVSQGSQVGLLRLGVGQGRVQDLFLMTQFR